MHLFKNQKISILRGKSLINHFIKHLMIMDTIEHKNSIKSRANNTNQTQFARSKDQATRIIKGSHCRRWKWSSTMVEWELPLQIWKFFKLTSRSTLQSLDLQELMKENCLDEGLDQRLASFDVKLTNFQWKKSELWVNLVEWGEILARWIWLSKACEMNEMRALFIEFRLGNFGGLEFGLEI